MAPRKKKTAPVARTKRAARGRAKKLTPEQGPEVTNHITDNDLESWAMREYAPNAATAALEEHLLTCRSCMARAESMREYVWGLHGALQQLTGSVRSER